MSYKFNPFTGKLDKDTTAAGGSLTDGDKGDITVSSSGSVWTLDIKPTGPIVGTTDAQTLTNKTLGDITETVYTITDGASVDLDPANGPIQLWTLGASRTATATNFAAGESMTIGVTAGANTLTWPTMTWVGGSAPTLATSSKPSFLRSKKKVQPEPPKRFLTVSNTLKPLKSSSFLSIDK